MGRTYVQLILHEYGIFLMFEQNSKPAYKTPKTKVQHHNM